MTPFTQPSLTIKYINGTINAAETIETWYIHKSKGEKPTDMINLCFHVIPSLLQTLFGYKVLI